MVDKLKYRQVSIPTELVHIVEDSISKSKLGYRNVTEFVIDSIRRRISELEKDSTINKEANN